ncbi:uncharacterized protein LY89DRAFT_776277 [Mollisia scopiformis]|uniref:Uncharacterized protein n=1 Tax=Mollisia scopiformis TaxID=149040 RepID=A0A194XV60_MOLSC|nr:uncharacterized protein LY89DRAFT_776277 [Mollisia scopiformis]KUJ24098.1 hypothetical protein LY89DRAFT_776277 [Mollisia scopiformis]
MSFASRLPGALTVLFYLQCFYNVVSAQNETEILPGFGDTVQILGAMERTDQDFKDGLALDLFSPTNRTLIVKQNKSPLAAQFITGTTGEPFVALSNYSYIIQMNETANDLIAKIEIPYDPVQLNEIGVQEANTYVATLSSDKTSWVINDATRNVHRSENNTRIIKMTSLDGEYLLVGRQTVDTSNIFVQYGQGATRTVNMTGGIGTQEAEFVDGLRFSVQTNTSMTMNADIKNGINPGTLPANTQSLNSFAWVVNTSAPFMKINAQMLVPFNRNMLVALKPAGSSPSTMLTVAKRPLNATNGQFMPVNAGVQVVKELPEDRIQIPEMTQLDGQYVILVTNPKPVGQTLPASSIVGPEKKKRASHIVKYV